MKKGTTIWILAALFGVVLFGCKPDAVNPDRSNGKRPDLAGAASEEHPNLDTVCKYSDSVFFRSEDNSFYVNVCNDGDFCNAVVVPCVGPQPKWGSFVMYNGYLYGYDSLTNSNTATHYLDVDFSLAAGLFCKTNDWIFTINGTTIIDQNTGYPQVGTDWSQLAPDDARQEWKVRAPVAELPSPCFELACRVRTVQLSLFCGEIPGTIKDVWAVNPNYVPNGPNASVTPYTISYCPLACLDACYHLPLGWPGQLPNCITLDATTEFGTSYQWSTGQTTQTISVCPTTTTTYTVTITNGSSTTTRDHKVNVEDIRCGNPNQPQHKVWVCHIPPGNPNNPQDICIDWSGVPAHVKRFRAPNSNPRLGHDSGCEIGHCGGNPCN